MKKNLLFFTITFLISTTGSGSPISDSIKAVKKYNATKEVSSELDQNNDPNFIKSFRKELSFAVESHNKSLILNSYVRAVSFYFRNRNSIRAIDLIHEAEVFFKKHNSEAETAMLYSMLSGFYLRQQDYVNGLSTSKKALRLGKKEVGTTDYSLYLANVGTALFEQKRYQEAIYYYHKAVTQITRKEQNVLLYRQIKAVSLSNLCTCYLKSGDLTKAKKLLTILDTIIFKFPKQDLDLVLARYYKAKMLYNENTYDFKNAVLFATKGYEVSNRLPWYRLEFLDKLIEYHQQTNHSDEALKYALIKSEFSEKTVQQDQKEMLRIMHLNFRLAENEKIAFANTKLHQERASSWYIQRNLWLVLASSLILTLSLFWRNFRLKSLKIKIDNEKIKLEKEYISLELEKNQKDLTTITLKHAHTNDFILSVKKELEGARNVFKSEQLTMINKIIRKLQNTNSKAWWKEFELRFSESNSKLLKELTTNFPELSRNERRLCAFLTLDLSTKEISNITGQTVSSITMARIRLRKKLGITNEQVGITQILQKITNSN